MLSDIFWSFLTRFVADMRSLLPIFCCFAVGSASIPDATYVAVNKIVNRYTELASLTAREVMDQGEDVVERNRILSSRFSVYPHSTKDEVVHEFARLTDAVKSVAASLEKLVEADKARPKSPKDDRPPSIQEDERRSTRGRVIRPPSQFPFASHADDRVIEDLIEAWETLHSNAVDELSAVLHSGNERPCGKVGPAPPRPPTTTTTHFPGDVDSINIPSGPTTSFL